MKLRTRILSLVLCLVLLPIIPLSVSAELPPEDDSNAGALNLTVLPGASIRKTEGSTGIRFDTTVDRAAYDALINAGYTMKQGTLIVPTSYLTGLDTSNKTVYEALKALEDEGKAIADIPISGFYTPTAEELTGDFADVDTDSVYIWRAALTNIRDTNYTRDFVPVSYIVIEEEGVPVCILSSEPDSSVTRSIYHVAKQAYTAGETDEIVKGFVNSVLELTVDKFGTPAVTDVTGETTALYSPAFAQDTITFSNTDQMKSIILNGTALSAKQFAALDYVDDTTYALRASAYLTSSFASVGAVENVGATYPTNYQNISHSVNSENGYLDMTFTGPVSGKSNVSIWYNNSTSTTWTTYEFKINLDKPSVIPTGDDKTVLNLVLARNPRGNSAYMMTVEAYENYFKIGDDNCAATPVTGEYSKEFSYGEWYTLSLTWSSGGNYALAWSSDTESGNATYGSENAAKSNNYYDHGGSAWSSSIGLDIDATTSATVHLQMDYLKLIDDVNTQGTDDSITFHFNTDKWADITVCKFTNTETNKGITVNGGTVKHVGISSSANTSETPYSFYDLGTTANRGQVRFETYSAPADWNVVVIDFKLKINSSAPYNGASGNRGVTFFVLKAAPSSFNAENSLSGKTLDLTITSGSADAGTVFKGVAYGEWADVKLVLVQGDATHDTQIALYYQGQLWKYATVACNSALKFGGFGIQNYGNMEIAYDIQNMNYTFYHVD